MGGILYDVSRRSGAGVVADLVDGLAGEVVRPLAVGLADVERALVAAEDTRTVDSAVSSVQTTVVQAWPLGDQVPRRFATATNEVLLEGIESYPDRFADHLHATFESMQMPSGQRPSRDDSAALRGRAGDHLLRRRPVRPATASGRPST